MDAITAMIPLISAAAGALIGGWVVHSLARRRELEGTRRTQRIDYLITAYQRLADASNRRETTFEQRRALESAVSDIVLLGDAHEVEAARAFMVDFAEKGDADLGDLLGALRQSLRRELGLEELVVPSPYSLRLIDPSGSPD